MSMPKTLLYAELLANIRQVSVIAALETPCDSSTEADLSPDGRQFLLHHDGNVDILNLPGGALPGTHLQKPMLGARELSWRLPSTIEPHTPSAESGDGPWPAKDLRETSEFKCRNCGGAVVGANKIMEWKDLPSEGWAEMMDFWHCHKPSDHEQSGSNGPENHSHHDEEHATSRGYGANTKFMARPTVGFVDPTTMLLADSDCSGTEEQISPLQVSPQYQRLVCKSCKSYLGHVDQHAEGYRLYKWRLKTIQPPSLTGPLYYQPSTASIITTQLQSIMLAQCSSRLLLLPITWKPSSQAVTELAPKEIMSDSAGSTVPPLKHCFLSLWILNPVLRYSTTNTIDRSPSTSQSKSAPGVVAMKIFWKSIDAANANMLMESDGTEDVSLPIETILELEASLRDSARSLPPSARKFQGWEVGLLERF